MIFVITFFVFNGEAFVALSKYKIVTTYKTIMYEVTRPPNLTFWKDVDIKTVDQTTGQPIISNQPASNQPASNQPASNQPIISNQPVSKTPLPSKPAEAISQNILDLPKFNIKAPIWEVEKPDLKSIYKKLRQGVVLFPGSADIGQGQSIIIGHSSAYPWEPGRYKSVFSLLSQFKVGDKINVFWQGKTYVFSVIDKKIFLPWPQTKQTTENLFQRPAKPTLVLQSCWPVGVDNKRIAIQAILVNSN